MCAACACLITGSIAAVAIGMTQMASTCLSWIHCSICWTCVCTSKFGSATATLIPAPWPAALSAFAVLCRPGTDSDSGENPSLIVLPAARDWVLAPVLLTVPLPVVPAVLLELHAARAAAAPSISAAAAAWLLDVIRVTGTPLRVDRWTRRGLARSTGGGRSRARLHINSYAIA